ncbi:hypothetical protein MAR_029162 [Mya arenaria]|uniref:Uncharacterized protein n=1 Tax=Mya arenaria TaxID=6604 RepID=A0ABY7DFN6_MYAAR|nr:hypothetical protein MAR_029162 [Mya arenaria]
MADSSGKVTGVDSNAIYYEVSPTIICILRLYNVLTLLMVLISFTICIVQGIKEDSSHFLLAINLLLSGMVSIVCSADKYWYIFLVSSIIIFQAITTDVYAFHKAPPPITPPPTHRTFPTTPYTGTTMTWRTIVTPTTMGPTVGK